MSDAVRVDLWLDIACLFKTRSAAKQACDAGRVSVNDQVAKSNRLIRDGDRLRINRPHGRHQGVVVRQAVDRHIKKSDAKDLYDDVTPQPTEDEVEMRQIERLYRAASHATGTPDRNQRRVLRRLKERN